MLTLWEQPVLSVCLKANLDGTIFAYDYCVRLACVCGGRGGGGERDYSPIKVTGVLVVPFGGLNFWIGTA